jgi:hypothetical protein
MTSGRPGFPSKLNTASCTRQYVQPVLYNRAGIVDIPKQSINVAADLQLARDWKPGSIDETAIKRSTTEAGFRKLPYPHRTRFSFSPVGVLLRGTYQKRARRA